MKKDVSPDGAEEISVKDSLESNSHNDPPVDKVEVIGGDGVE